MSDSFTVYVLLALSGGAMDAYSYLCRGKVFANAQTGNMLLFGVNLAERSFSVALKYAIPVLAFILGVIISDIVRYNAANKLIHWRQITIAFEAAMLFAVGLMPQSLNIAANALTSLVCGIQVESFRSVKGNSIATTMCIGNLRSGTYNFDKFITTKNRKYLKKSIIYYSVILFFIMGISRQRKNKILKKSMSFINFRKTFLKPLKKIENIVINTLKIKALKITHF